MRVMIMVTMMTEDNFNILSPAETERLAILAEEMGEALQVIGKILRHGYESVNPTLPENEQTTNREDLTYELGHVEYAISLMVAGKDIQREFIDTSRSEKVFTILEWIHHN